jgi:hypothetical protein
MREYKYLDVTRPEEVKMLVVRDLGGHRVLWKLFSHYANIHE